MTQDAGGPLVVAIFSEKGGVGKTALTSGMAAVAAERGVRVVAGDLDPRATLTDELAVDDPKFSLNDLLFVDPGDPMSAPDPAEAVAEVLTAAGAPWPSLVRVLPAERALAHRESDPTTGMDQRLSRAVDGMRGEVDLVLLDVPPRAGGRLAGTALLAADLVVIPATLTTDGVIGAGEARRSTQQITQVNRGLRVAGIVRSIVPREPDMREIHRECDRQLADTFGALLLDVQVRSYAVREEARNACVPITAAPGREARMLVDAYGRVLDHLLATQRNA